MIYYLLGVFCSALSNTLCIYCASKGYLPLPRREASTIFLHCDVLIFFYFFILYFIKKSKNQIHFSIKDTFSNKSEIKQLFFFAIPVCAAYYKTVLQGFIDLSNIAVTAMIKPLMVWFLAVVFLKEKVNVKIIKYAILALFGAYVSHIHKMESVPMTWLLYSMSYVVLASFGDITRRYYCRKRNEDMQALCVESVMYGFYGFLILSLKGAFNIKLLFNPIVMGLALIMFVNHLLIIYAVRRATSVVALEFLNLAKPIFTIVLAAILMNDIPNLYKIGGAILIALSVAGFNAVERKDKLEQKKRQQLKKQKEEAERQVLKSAVTSV